MATADELQEAPQQSLTAEELAVVRSQWGVLIEKQLVSPDMIRMASVEQLVGFGLSPGGALALKKAFPTAAAGGAAAADVEVCAEVVHLSIEGGGAPFSMDSHLYNRKLQVVAIKDTLAAKRLSVVCINGSTPTTDEKGYTVQTYEPGSTVNITAEPRADDSFKE